MINLDKIKRDIDENVYNSIVTCIKPEVLKRWYRDCTLEIINFTRCGDEKHYKLNCEKALLEYMLEIR